MDLAWNMVSNRSSVFLCLINVCQHYRRTTLSLSSSHHLDSRQKADWVRVEDINNYKQWKTCFFINWIWPHSLRWGHGLSLFVCVHVHMFCSRLLGSSQTARHQCGLWIERDFSLNWCQSRDSGFCCTPQDSSSAHQVCLNTHTPLLPFHSSLSCLLPFCREDLDLNISLCAQTPKYLFSSARIYF